MRAKLIDLLAEWLRANDTIVKQQVEYKDIGRSGRNVLWDFGKLIPVDEKYALIYFPKKNADSIMIGKEHRTRYYYKCQNDSLLLWGFENATTRIDNLIPELLLRYPVYYQDKTHSYYQGKGYYCGRLKVSVLGRITTEADAYGVIILPGGDTLRHVLRVKTIKMICETLSSFNTEKEMFTIKNKTIVPTDSIEWLMKRGEQVLVVETYRWYACGYRYPIFETIRTGDVRDSLKTEYFSTAFFYPPSAHLYLENDKVNMEEQQRLLTADSLGKESHSNSDEGKKGPLNSFLDFSYNVYPNPVQALLTLEYYVSTDAKVSYGVYGLSGQQLYVSSVRHRPEGVYDEQVDMSGYLRGEYILQIRVNEKVFSEKIIKR